jgi:diguanylate cyclase (GGDEF)-like protein/PAS domain S-box-containing protein
MPYESAGPPTYVDATAFPLEETARREGVFSDSGRFAVPWDDFPEVVCELARAGHFVRASERWADFGYRPSELVGRPWSELIHPGDKEACTSAFGDASSSTGRTVAVEARLRTHGGEYRWTRWAFRARGEATAIASVSTIGDQRASFEQYRLGVEASPMGLLMVDADGTIKLVNKQVESMFGYRRDELLGATVDMLVPVRFRETHRGVRTQFLATPTTRAMGQGRDLFGMRRDGSEFPIEIVLNPLVIDGATRVLASIVDVTARKRQEFDLHARLGELQRKQEEMDLLSEMSSLLQHALCAEEAHEIVATFGQRLLRFVSVDIYAFSSSRDTLERTASWGSDSPADVFEPQDCWALRRAQVHRSSNESFPRCRHGWRGNELWQLCIPMSAHGQSTGVIMVSSAEQGDEREQRALERIGKATADQLALALSNIQLRDRLRGLSLRDALTGLFNRRYLEESVARELRRAQRRHSTVSVLMIDVDHFKAFNDSHGHPAADQVLRDLGSLIATNVRADDIPCRFGGEEFVLVLPDCALEDGIRRAEELRAEAARNISSEITLSIGVAEWPRDGRSLETVLRKADQALYDAKAAGRNRVCSTRPPPELAMPAR